MVPVWFIVLFSLQSACVLHIFVGFFLSFIFPAVVHEGHFNFFFFFLFITLLDRFTVEQVRPLMSTGILRLTTRDSCRTRYSSLSTPASLPREHANKKAASPRVSPFTPLFFLFPSDFVYFPSFTSALSSIGVGRSSAPGDASVRALSRRSPVLDSRAKRTPDPNTRGTITRSHRPGNKPRRGTFVEPSNAHTRSFKVSRHAMRGKNNPPNSSKIDE